MNPNQRIALKIIMTLNILFMPIALYAMQQIKIIPPYNVVVYDAYLQKLYADEPVRNRFGYFSAAFLGKPYTEGALGEGSTGQFDQSPLYRVDTFDCMTYVSTVLALLNAHHLQEFKEMIIHINYQNGVVAYENRNHFTSVDWNLNNERQSLIKDITRSIHNNKGQSLAKMTNVYINKKAWYDRKTLANIKLLSAIMPQKQQQLLQQLRGLKTKVFNQESHLPYVPLTALFNQRGQPNEFMFNQIPSGSIIEIVRANWPIRSQIGTKLDVSHLGFAVRTRDGLMFRAASLKSGKVVDIPLADYLGSHLGNSTMLGINIQLILPINQRPTGPYT